MPYIFENLGPERFQHLCQALLVKDYKDLQCFPIGQPDGGRDALSRGDVGGAITVGQIKFKRREEDEVANAKWMIAALKGELPKIKRLAENGATRYIMMTNAKSSSHEKTGKVDLVQAWLDENVPIEAFCLWRDDLERRLDGDQGLKLSYPSMLTGEDTLTLIVKALMGPQQERLSRVLRAFVAEQYRKDEEVKFRQLDLSNSLLGLFVDVPIDVSGMFWGASAREIGHKARRAVRRLSVLTNHGTAPSSDDFDFRGGPEFTAGAADLLLDREVQAHIPWTVLQGAPGQGKSTLAQYVCQVHRARYLGRGEFLEKLPNSHSGASFRLPIKVDLRDLAGYLNGRPFLGQESVPADTHKTLERFLSILISIQSGGLQFSPDDFAETAAGVPLLLFLDGLDEVADLDLRKLLVDKVLEGLSRLKETQADIQVVVTSRPSLFGQAPSFSRSFVRFDLAPIGINTINAYTDKWVVARKLPDDRAREVKGILREKLDLGHIRDLTRNPMQLTILLSLINSIGYSLPDVRTDLYRQYVDLFMTREAEKSPVVREHRLLLMEIVEYLAWTLQCSAESDRSSGSVTRDELRALIADRLTTSNHSMSILDDLFSGGLERVYVLVQRVEGLYEFEVQPLREYFAAKFLYSSAPVSSFRHQVVHGDRAQRFEAIAANPYWANVTRFYAGFYEGGEIGALSTSLRELAASKSTAEALSAKSIGAALLSDWIFRSKRFLQDDVIRLVFDPASVHLASMSKLSGFGEGSLPAECGRETLAKLVFAEHIAPGEARPTQALCQLLRRNGGELLVEEFAEWVNESEGLERTTRLRVALTSGGFSNMSVPMAEELLFSDDPSNATASRRMRSVMSSEPNLINRSPKVAGYALESLLAWGGFGLLPPNNYVLRLAWFVTPQFMKGPDPDLRGDAAIGGDLLVAPSQKRLADVVDALEKAHESVLKKDSWEEGDPWTSTIEALRSEVGDTWSTYRLAVVNVGFTAASDKTATFDLSAPLFTQARFARVWRGRTSWWGPLLRSEDPLQRLFWVAMLLAWGPAKHVAEHLQNLNEILEGLSDEDFSRLLEVLSLAAEVRQYRGGRMRTLIPLDAGTVSARLARALIDAFGEGQVAKVPTDIKSNEAIQKIMARKALGERLRTFPGWKGLSTRKRTEWLALFAQCRREAVLLPEEATRRLHADVSTLDDAFVSKVLRSAVEYPRAVVTNAYEALQISYKPRMVRDIADSEHWTFE